MSKVSNIYNNQIDLHIETGEFSLDLTEANFEGRDSFFYQKEILLQALKQELNRKMTCQNYHYRKS